MDIHTKKKNQSIINMTKLYHKHRSNYTVQINKENKLPKKSSLFRLYTPQLPLFLRIVMLFLTIMTFSTTTKTPLYISVTIFLKIVVMYCTTVTISHNLEFILHNCDFLTFANLLLYIYYYYLLST